uniref:C2H2-type domain-containing protein n=1 Tax=Mus musculus TaxID=10090 RepID=Q8C3E0_MOUSE|nr:unnamed protein product [Mus musculus]
MEESHFNSNPYFWPSIPTVSGQIENTMFINKMKDQLLPEKGCGLAPPHYPTLLTVPASVSLSSGISMDTESKSEQLTPHSQASVTQNITVVPVPSTGLMTAGVSCSQRWRREGSQSRGPGLVITSPSGSLVTTASAAQTFPISAPMIVSALPPGSQALQVVPDLSKKVASTLTEEGGGGGGGGGTVAPPKPPRGRQKKRMLESGLPEMNDPYVLGPGDDDDHQKDGKTYRSEGNCGTGNGQSLGLMDSVPGSTTNLLCDPGCRMCSLTFYSKSEMQIHSKSHTETKPHKVAALAPRPSPTAPTWPSTSGSTQGPSPIVVTSVRNPSASSHIWQQHTRADPAFTICFSSEPWCAFNFRSMGNRRYWPMFKLLFGNRVTVDSLQDAHGDHQAPQVPALLQDLRQHLLPGSAPPYPLRGQALQLLLLPEGLPPALPPPAAHTVRERGGLLIPPRWHALPTPAPETHNHPHAGGRGRDLAGGETWLEEAITGNREKRSGCQESLSGAHSVLKRHSDCVILS